MNIRIIYLVFMISLGVIACQDDETYLDLSLTEIDMDASGTVKKIKIETNANMWQISGATEWLSVERDSGDLVISAESNQTRERREAKVVVVAGDKYARILITQEGSTRAVGEPYPDAANPIGIIYKVLDGGNHGKVVSFDQTVGRWGKSNETNSPTARDLYIGLNNTRNMIEKHHEKAEFESEYYAFWWIHEVKNGGDLDGGWCLPAFYELLEFYYIIVGRRYVQPASMPSMTPMISHNIYVRDAFNHALETYGGTPVNFESAHYWTSSEYNATNVYIDFFAHNSGTNLYQDKSGEYYIRAVMDF